MIKLDDITSYAKFAVGTPNADGIAQSGDVIKAAKQVEEVFLNELLKVMFQSTELGKQKTVSDYLPVFTMEISKSLSDRGVGVQDFLLKSPAFIESVERGVGGKRKAASNDAMVNLDALYKRMNIKAYEEIVR